MKFVCKSIVTLLAFYVLYSECITLPNIIKKNKKLVYLLIGLVYLSTYDTVEGAGELKGWIAVVWLVVNLIISTVWAVREAYDPSTTWEVPVVLWVALVCYLIALSMG